MQFVAKFSLATLGLILSIGVANAQSGCGNGASGGVGGGKSTNGGGPSSGTKDPIITYTANEYRRTDDLKVSGAVGDQPLTWWRQANSRTASGLSWFGDGHSWRHGFQWELADAGPDVTGLLQWQLIYPTGEDYLFVQTAPSSLVFKPTVANGDIVTISGSEVYLQRSDGTRYRFTSWLDASSAIHFELTESFDAYGQALTYTYDSEHRLHRVTEPAGRWIEVNYAAIDYTAGEIHTLQTFSGATNSLGKIAIPIDPKKARFFRYLADGENPMPVAEMTFWTLSGGTLIEVQSKDPFGSPSSTPGSTPASAFDNNTATAWVPDVIDFAQLLGPDEHMKQFIGARIKPTLLPEISEVRLRVPAAYAGQTISGSIQALEKGDISRVVIASVESSDGQTVSYTYSQFDDPTLESYYLDLTTVDYDDSTQATYVYAQVFPLLKPLIVTYNEPRSTYPLARSRAEYYTNVGGAYGRVNYQKAYDGTLVTTITADAAHKPVAIYASNGGTDTFTMVDGRVVILHDALSRATSYTYGNSNFGYLESETDQLERVTLYTKSDYGNDLEVVYPDNSDRTWTRDSLDLVLTETDELGRTTTYTRDSAHRITRIDYPDSSYETFVYNAFGQITQHRRKNGGYEYRTYDSRGLLTASTDALSNVTTYTYDSRDRLATVTDPLSHTTSSAYNERDLVTAITYADSSTRTFTYDDYGNKLTETDELGHTTTWTYNQFKQVVTVTDPLTRTTSRTYAAGDFEDHPVTITMPSGSVTAFTYDLVWNTLTRTEGYGTSAAATTSFVYTNADRLKKTIDPLGNETLTTYDLRDRPLSVKKPSLEIVTSTYDLAGNLLTLTESNGRVTVYTYDAMNRRLTTTDALSQVTQFIYDAAGNLSTLTDANSHVYTYIYDLLDRKTQLSYPDSSHENWSYDAAGRMSTMTTRAGQVATLTYDSRNRELGRNWSDTTPDITRTYDAAGRLLTASNGSVALAYTYDAANQLLTETSNLSALVSGLTAQTLTYTYTADGQRANVTYPSGSVVAYGYTSRRQLESVTADGPPALATYTYDLAGRRTGKVLENGVSTTYTYDGSAQLLSLNHALSTTTLATYAYTLDTGGRREAMTETNPLLGNRSVSYNYDSVNQLKLANDTVRRFDYNYDAAGNRLQTQDTVGGITTYTNYTANSLNQYTNIDTKTPSYDANGNWATYAAWTYTYDAQNRLINAQNAISRTSFVYDPLNRCVQRKISSRANGSLPWTLNQTLVLTYDGWSLVEERNGAGTLTQSYFHGADMDEILAKVNASGTFYYLQDGLGSVVALTGLLGTVAEAYRYDPYGAPSVYDANSAVLTGTAKDNRFLFTGREWLAELEFFDCRNRIYSASWGRFLQKDPLGFSAGDCNIYRYVGNSPVIFIDLFGLCKIRVYVSPRGFGIKGLHHAYAANSNHARGRNGSSGKHGGGGAPDPNNIPEEDQEVGTIQLPDGVTEEDYFNYLNDHAEDGIYLPWINDCHSSITDAAEAVGGEFIPNEDYPGRIGD